MDVAVSMAVIVAVTVAVTVVVVVVSRAMIVAATGAVCETGRRGRVIVIVGGIVGVGVVNVSAAHRASVLLRRRPEPVPRR